MADAYQNKISILIAAQDEASAVIAASAEQVQAAQDALTASTESLGAAADTTNGQFVSLGATSDELAANMRAIASAAEGAVGGITILGDETAATNDVIISSNDLLKASYDEVAASRAKSGAISDITQGAGNGLASSVGAGGLVAKLSNPYVLAGAAIAGGLAMAVKSASDLQAQITRLYTTAGETTPLYTLRNGILAISDATGVSTDQLTMGLYHISSAGYNAAGGLTILKAAAEGARAENANLSDVANALVTSMHDFGATSNQATGYMNMLITTTALGNTTLEDLSTSLATVLPKAKEAGLSFSQVGAAMATLTEGGVSAQQAAQDLAALIQSLVAPTAQQTKAMEQMGLDATSLSKNLGKVGLTGTLNELITAVTAHSKDGQIIQSSFQDATLATRDLNTELANSPPALQKLEQQLLTGAISFASYKKAVQALPEGLTNLGKQFESTYNSANSFNSQLVAAINNSPTVASELKTITGQSNSLNAVLELTGANQAKFNANNTAIANSASHAGANIDGWSKVQNNLNAQVDEFMKKVVNAGKAIGGALIPYLTDAFKFLNEMASAAGDVINKLDQLGGKINSLSHGAASGKNVIGNIVKSVVPGLQAFAGGTSYAPGGMALVGEQGPELVNLPRGSQVLNNAESRSAMSTMGKGVIIQNLNVYNDTDVGLVTRQIGWRLANGV